MSTPSYGLEQLGAIVAEDTFDTSKAFTTDHGIGFTSVKITPKLDFQPYKEHTGSASLVGEHAGKRGGDFEIEGYLKPNGAGVQPDCGPLILAAGFAFDAGVYELAATQPTSLQFARKAGSSLYEVINGLFISQLEIELAGAMPAMFRARGGFASYGMLVGEPTTNSSSYLAGVTSITMAATDAGKIRPGVRVAFGSEDNSGAGYLVTAVATNGLGLTISPALANGIGTSQAITAVFPAVTPAGTIVGGVEDGLSIDSTAVGFISQKITVDTGIHGLDKEATANRINRLARGARSITTETQFYFLDENAGALGLAWNGTTRDLVARAGANTAGVRTTINLPAVRLNVAEIELPEADEAIYTASGVARRDGNTNETEITIDTN